MQLFELIRHCFYLNPNKQILLQITKTYSINQIIFLMKTNKLLLKIQYQLELIYKTLNKLFVAFSFKKTLCFIAFFNKEPSDIP